MRYDLLKLDLFVGVTIEFNHAWLLITNIDTHVRVGDGEGEGAGKNSMRDKPFFFNGFGFVVPSSKCQLPIRL